MRRTVRAPPGEDLSAPACDVHADRCDLSACLSACVHAQAGGAQAGAQAGARDGFGLVAYGTTVALAVLIALAIWAACGCTLFNQDKLDAIVDQLPAEIPAATVTTTTTTTTTTQPPASGEYRITKATSSMVYWTGPDFPWATRLWTRDEVAADLMLDDEERGDVCGESHLYRASGKGGQFDHVRPATKSRDWKNVRGGHGCWAAVGVPANGEACTLWAVSYDGRERIKIGAFQWVESRWARFWSWLGGGE